MEATTSTSLQVSSHLPPIAAEAVPNGYQLAWENTTTNQYGVWSIDSGGNYTGLAIGAVSASDFAFQTLETAFQQDLNGGGFLATSVESGTAGGDDLDLTGNVQSTMINLAGDTASASSGMDAPTLTFLGTPDTITLGVGAANVQYDMQASGGIETISGFRLGTDFLNIDLHGAARSSLRAFDKSLGGISAICLANTADLTHGIVLLNISPSVTAGNLLANHSTAEGGHVIIH